MGSNFELSGQETHNVAGGGVVARVQAQSAARGRCVYQAPFVGRRLLLKLRFERRLARDARGASSGVVPWSAAEAARSPSGAGVGDGCELSLYVAIVGQVARNATVEAPVDANTGHSHIVRGWRRLAVCSWCG